MNYEEKMRYPLACETWDHEELGMIQKVINSNRFTMGPEVAKFEEQFAEKVGKNHAVMVNSGSSANLLMIASLVLNDDIDLNPGDRTTSLFANLYTILQIMEIILNIILLLIIPVALSVSGQRS